MSLLSIYACGCVATCIFFTIKIMFLFRKSAREEMFKTFPPMDHLTDTERRAVLGTALFLILVIAPLTWPISIPFIYARIVR